MMDGTSILDATIMSGRDNLSIANENRADRYAASLSTRPGLFDRGSQEFLIFTHQGLPVGGTS
jgi:hypothetical protein